MANTHRFNVKVKLGGKPYPPGSDVPIGGKNGLPKEEIERIEARFGKWAGRTLGEQEQIAALAEEKRVLQVALDKAAGTDVQAENDRLKKVIEQLEGDNQVLAARVAELEKAASQ